MQGNLRTKEVYQKDQRCSTDEINTYVGPTIGMIGDLYSKSMNPVEQRAYQDVKSHGLNSGLSTGLGIAAEYAGIPSQIATPAINAASAAMQTSYAQNAYGYSVQQGRRSNAISALVMRCRNLVQDLA